MDWVLPELPPAPPPLDPPVVELDPGFLRQLPFKDARATVAACSVGLALHPQDMEAYFWRGEARVRSREPEQAISDFEAFLFLSPKNDRRRLEIQLRLAALYDDRGDDWSALRVLNETITTPLDQVSFSGWHAYLCNKVAWQLASPRDARLPQSVLHLAEKAVMLEPFNWAAQNTRGAVLYRLGRYDASIQCLEKNLEISGRRSSLDLFFLAMNRVRLGDYDRARAEFDLALAKSKPDPPFDAVELADFASSGPKPRQSSSRNRRSSRRPHRDTISLARSDEHSAISRARRHVGA